MSDSISQHIATLLRRHDCVIVPRLGAFVATWESAEPTATVMNPPMRRVSFNPAMAHDDGLLASSVSRRMKISFEHARERVAAESALIQRRLNAEGCVGLPYVGELQRASDGRLEFIPGRAWSLGLPAVAAAKAAPAFEVVRPADAADGNDRGGDKAVAVVRVPLRLRWVRAAVAAVVLATLGFALSTPIDVEQAQYASLAAPTFTAPEAPEFPMPQPVSDLEISIAKAPQPAVIHTQPSSPRYVVVVASLPSLDKAREYVANHQGDVSLKILESGDKFRIYAAAGVTAEEAQAAAAAIDGFSSRYPDAWICRR